MNAAKFLILFFTLLAPAAHAMGGAPNGETDITQAPPAAPFNYERLVGTYQATNCFFARDSRGEERQTLPTAECGVSPVRIVTAVTPQGKVTSVLVDPASDADSIVEFQAINAGVIDENSGSNSSTGDALGGIVSGIFGGHYTGTYEAFTTAAGLYYRSHIIDSGGIFPSQKITGYGRIVAQLAADGTVASLDIASFNDSDHDPWTRGERLTRR